MRDILGKLEEDGGDPVRRAQKAMQTPKPKRFYKTAAVAQANGGFAVQLDGKTAKTPGGKPLIVESEKAAALAASEFAVQGEFIDAMSMPVLRLINTALDGVSLDPQAVLEDVLHFAGTDLLCYRAESPEGLVALQDKHWNPVLDWAEAELGARMALAAGIVHVTQPREAIAAISVKLRDFASPLPLAALHSMTSLTGSALLALAAATGESTAEAAWAAAHVDEDWTNSFWGEDAEAQARRAARWREMQAAAALLAALKS